MTGEQQIEDEIEELAGLQELATTYEEIAVTRMRRIRSSVLETREFIAGISKMFAEVAASYKGELVELMKRKKIQDQSKLSLIKRNGKTAAVLFSANTRLYGSLIKDTFESYNEFINKNEVDVVIVGRLGRLFFEEQHPKREIIYFDFPDNQIDPKILRVIIDAVLQYEKLIVFFGKFENVITQKPESLDVYGNKELQETGSGLWPNVKYFFEPSLEKIVTFFETEIFASIVEQTVNESNLAKFASRMVSLDRATDNIREQLKQVRMEKRVVSHRSLNRKQLNSLLGLALWKVNR